MEMMVYLFASLRAADLRNKRQTCTVEGSKDASHELNSDVRPKHACFFASRISNPGQKELSCEKLPAGEYFSAFLLLYGHHSTITHA